MFRIEYKLRAFEPETAEQQSQQRQSNVNITLHAIAIVMISFRSLFCHFFCKFIVRFSIICLVYLLSIIFFFISLSLSLSCAHSNLAESKFVRMLRATKSADWFCFVLCLLKRLPTNIYIGPLCTNEFACYGHNIHAAVFNVISQPNNTMGDLWKIHKFDFILEISTILNTNKWYPLFQVDKTFRIFMQIDWC